MNDANTQPSPSLSTCETELAMKRIRRLQRVRTSGRRTDSVVTDAAINDSLGRQSHRTSQCPMLIEGNWP